MNNEERVFLDNITELSNIFVSNKLNRECEKIRGLSKYCGSYNSYASFIAIIKAISESIKDNKKLINYIRQYNVPIASIIENQAFLYVISHELDYGFDEFCEYHYSLIRDFLTKPDKLDYQMYIAIILDVNKVLKRFMINEMNMGYCTKYEEIEYSTRVSKLFDELSRTRYGITRVTSVNGDVKTLEIIIDADKQSDLLRIGYEIDKTDYFGVINSLVSMCK